MRVSGNLNLKFNLDLTQSLAIIASVLSIVSAITTILVALWVTR